MAIWQFVVGLIPSRWCGTAGNDTTQLVDRDGYTYRSTAWQQYQPDAKIVSLISEILPASASWHEDLEIWGDETGSDIRVCYEGTQVESVMARIDTRTDPARMCVNVVELAAGLGSSSDCSIRVRARRRRDGQRDDRGIIFLPSPLSAKGKTMKSVFEPGSYSLLSGNGGAIFIRIEGARLKFFDSPVDPLRGTLHVQETDFNPSSDNETEHLIEGDVLLYVEGGAVRRLRLSL